MNNGVENRIFISYSHKDEELKKALCAKIQEQLDFDTEFWDDSELQPGANWFEEIGKAIEESNAALLLASKHFFDSDFIKKHELKPFWEKWEKGRKAGQEVSRPGTVKLIIVPIGDDGGKSLGESKLSAIQAVCPISDPLPENPDEWPIEGIVKNIRRAIDPTRVALEEKLVNQPYSILKSLTRGHETRLYLAETTMPPKPLFSQKFRICGKRSRLAW